MLRDPRPAMGRLLLATLLLALLAGYGLALGSGDLPLDLAQRYQPPSWAHWFGTDSLGRDLWLRCVQGALSCLQIGLGAALLSGALALAVAALGRMGRCGAQLAALLTDSLLAMPHLLLLILIGFAAGGGRQAVILAIALTHWPRLALLLGAEAARVAESDYLRLSRRIGLTRWQCWWRHLLPALLPQWLIGVLLMFPHAVLHSAALSFLGFGLAPHEPSLGLMLAEALRYLNAGAWWLALFPGLLLLGLVLLFDQCARSVRTLLLES